MSLGKEQAGDACVRYSCDPLVSSCAGTGQQHVL
jgi:hypothetical protein